VLFLGGNESKLQVIICPDLTYNPLLKMIDLTYSNGSVFVWNVDGNLNFPF